MPNRILYYLNIVKGERRGERKQYCQIVYAEPNPNIIQTSPPTTANANTQQYS